ncbi:MAG: methionine--tRNA ligase [Francisellaceae bacterium]|nr:methionine--tRNA ligase [Francisellaceae bacterium]
MTHTPRRLLVTSALPYANGSLHLGHLLEHIQSDIWVRYQKIRKNECWFVCGDDAHGTPIMLQAEKLGISPEVLIKQSHAEHIKDLQDFYIQYDNFHTTHSDENKILASTVYKALNQNGDIVKKTIHQAYDEIKNMFLPDRYVKGTCPKCKKEDQYGDSCEQCGATYSPLELINPLSVISNTPPIRKESEHYFFRLENYKTILDEWFKKEPVPPEILNKLEEWFKTGLRDWDISRDGPYFGFEIPDVPNKYFYVWLDAPIGYMASFKNLCDRNTHIKFEDYWANVNNDTELYHFIGKDIVYFHALFWPAMLSGSNLRLPTQLFIHGFLTVNGQKMSKSRGTFIQTRTYLNILNPEYLRYYFAAKLNNTIEDIDLNLEDFVKRVNSDLVGKLINIASRLSGFITKQFEGKLSEKLINNELFTAFVEKGNEIGAHFEARLYSRAIREIMDLADKANAFIDEYKPWSLIKDPTKLQHAHEVCSLGINLFKVLMTYLQMVLPQLALNVIDFLNIQQLDWDERGSPLLNHAIKTFKPLMTRIDQKEIEKMIDASKPQDLHVESSKLPSFESSDSILGRFPIKETISIEEFSKIDLRIAKIIQAESVPEAQKLLKLTLDLGDSQRQVFAGIKEAYNPEQLIGKLTVMVANLAPRKMRFGLSEGMVLASGPGGKDLWLLEPDVGAEPGMPVK